MQMDFSSFIETMKITQVVYVLLIMILADTALGVIRSFKLDYPNFSFKILPKFLVESVFPYTGGLLTLAAVAYLVGGPMVQIFYAAAVTVFLKFFTDIKDKISQIFG